MLKVFIVDDEPLARDEMAYLLKRTKEVEIVGEADCIYEALTQIESIKVDVMFIDIQLADDSGLVLAKKINEMDDPPQIVFATAYDEYALEAFELNAIDYILKPFEEQRVHHTIKKILNQRRHVASETKGATQRASSLVKLNKVALNVNEKIVMVTITDILYIRTQSGSTIIVTKKGSYEVNEPLIGFERKLKNTSIVRVHRAYLVNLDRIVEIEPWFHSTYNLIMEDGEKIPVSRTYVKDLKEFIGI